VKPWLALLAVFLAACDNVSRPNRPLPAISATGLDGAAWTRDSFSGKPWVVNVWMPGCSTCAREFPGLAELNARYGDEVGFLALSLQTSRARVEREARRHAIPFAVAIADGEVLGPLGVRLAPSTLFVKDGRIVAAASGYRDRAFFERRIRELVEE
jgi:thiol-disulfide isomerase/thioredoxin